MKDPIDALVAQMTLEEKVSMLAGADLWHTVPVPRLGIPAIKVTDGPNGARGSQSRGGPSSVCFPVGVALGATWNVDLARRVGQALADEVKAKGAHILLAPTVNIHRSPLAGRSFECYSEDPVLTGRLATNYISGLQSQGVGACIKHFVCNDSEFERHTISSEVAERPLREIYLAPFEMAIKEARPWAVMSAYNKLNETWCSENSRLLLDILKGEWAFDGIVMSDWYGTETPNVAAGGLDLEMPGPARWMGSAVLESVRSGHLPESAVDDKVRRLLCTIGRAGAFDHPDPVPEQAIDRPEHRQLVRQAAAEAIVLLKNAGQILPLDPARLRSIAVIGENAVWPPVEGGGSSHVTPHYVIAPYDAITERAGAGVSVEFELGCIVHKMLPFVQPGWLTTDDGLRHGLTVYYFDNADLSGEQAHTGAVDQSQLVWFGSDVAPQVDARRFSVRLAGTLTPPRTGRYAFGLMSTGPSRVVLDGVELIDNWTSGREGERQVEIDLNEGQAYRLAVEYAWTGNGNWRTVRLGCAPVAAPGAAQAAVDLAARSDVAIVFAGTTDEWESEGFDRADMDLPGDQSDLIERVAAANPNTIVVLNTGSPVPMPWLDRVAAVIEAWYPGQESGHAIADVLFGDANPCGKLPVTFPQRLQDTPAYINYPGENGQVLYGEGLFVGYRYYDKKDVEPLFPFGYGLSYTTFEYRNLALSAAEYGPDDEIGVSLEVRNAGARAGYEVVQLYVRDLASTLVRPDKELKAFAKVWLEPGESRAIAFSLDRQALAFYDPAVRHWVVEPGEFEVWIGGSSRDPQNALAARFTVKAVDQKPEPLARLHTGLPIHVLLDDPAGHAVLRDHIPQVLAAPELAEALEMSLDQIAVEVPTILTVAKLRAINEDLAKYP